MFDSIYDKKRILVTGHTGFKGSWLSLWLNQLGGDVIGFALDPYTPNDIFNKIELSKSITDLRGDIRDMGLLRQVFERYQPEMVFHLAAQPIVRESYDQPRETFEINSQGTVNVLEAIRTCPSVQAAVFITTDKVYSNSESKTPFKESDPLGGHDPYSASKASAEIIIDSYRKSFFSTSNHHPLTASARSGNVIGGGDWQKDRLIPDCIRAYLKKKPLILRNPEHVRPWQHVLEPIGGYILLGKHLLEGKSDFASPWNFGPEISSCFTVKEIVDFMMCLLEGSSCIMQNSNDNSKIEAKYLILDNLKAKTMLHWAPILNIDEIINFTVSWYKQAYLESNSNMLKYTLEQINQYRLLAQNRNFKWLD